jgi:hypothetical protein
MNVRWWIILFSSGKYKFGGRFNRFEGKQYLLGSELSGMLGIAGLTLVFQLCYWINPKITKQNYASSAIIKNLI